MSNQKTLRIFYSYSHKDQFYREQLENHLSLLIRHYDLQTWFDRQIHAGEQWEMILDEHLNTADLIFLLISPDFMASNYCYNKEMQHALERHAKGEVRVIPILVRHVYWKNAPFSHLQMLPAGAKPIKSWSDVDEAFYNIVIEVEKVIEGLLTPPQTEERWIDEDTSLSTAKIPQQSEDTSHIEEQTYNLDPSIVNEKHSIPQKIEQPISNTIVVHNQQNLVFDQPKLPDKVDPKALDPESITEGQKKKKARRDTILGGTILAAVSGLPAVFMIISRILWLQILGIILALVAILILAITITYKPN